MGLLKDIDMLTNRQSVVSIRGRLISKTESSVTMLIGSSLLEIPYQSIKNSEEIDSIDVPKTVELDIAKETKLLYKTVISAEAAADFSIGETVRGKKPLWPLKTGQVIFFNNQLFLVTSDGDIIPIPMDPRDAERLFGGYGYEYLY